MSCRFLVRPILGNDLPKKNYIVSSEIISFLTRRHYYTRNTVDLDPVTGVLDSFFLNEKRNLAPQSLGLLWILRFTKSTQVSKIHCTFCFGEKDLYTFLQDIFEKNLKSLVVIGNLVQHVHFDS